jgi:hypothetical protein
VSASGATSRGITHAYDDEVRLLSRCSLDFDVFLTISPPHRQNDVVSPTGLTQAVPIYPAYVTEPPQVGLTRKDLILVIVFSVFGGSVCSVSMCFALD